MGESSKSDEKDKILGKFEDGEMSETIELDQSLPLRGKTISSEEYPEKRDISNVLYDEGPPSFITESIPNYCSACNITFRFNSHYTNHCANIHRNYRPYICTRCSNRPSTFKDKYALIKHMRRVHDRDEAPKAILQPVTCDDCKTDHRGWKAFEKHAITVHEGVRMMICPQCPKRFYRRSSMLIHKQEKHPDTILVCKHCNNIFQHTDVLKDHEKYCETRQTNKRKESNVIEKPVDVKYVCGKCRSEFNLIKLLEEHYSQQHPGTGMHCCEYCGVTFRVKKYLEKHLDMKHPQEENFLKTTLKHRKRKRFVCEYCRGVFVGITEFEKHGHDMHPGQPLFRCQECDKGYTTRAVLVIHCKDNHGDDKTRCINCAKCFYNAFHLRKHETSCIKASEKIRRLKKEGKPYHYCDACDKYYMKASSFNLHLSTHEEYERCKFCKECFHKEKYPNGLANHMGLRHPLNDNIDALLRTIRKAETFVKIENVGCKSKNEN